MSIENSSQNNGQQSGLESVKSSPNLSENEAIKKAYALAIPRPEYAAGKLKLDFEYKFSTREILSATENDEGIAHIVIKKDGVEIFDFGELIPGDFVTPSYYIKRGISMKNRTAVEGGVE